MRNKYTPGPWYQDGFLVRTSKGINDILCEVTCNVNESGIGQGEIKEANARLMAAAPELLEAARVAMEIIGKECEPYFQRVYSMLKEAIAKAEGRR